MKTMEQNMSGQSCARPFPRSYWVVPGRLLAGFLPIGHDVAQTEEYMNGLLSCGIGYILNLMAEDELRVAGRDDVPYEPLLQRLGSAYGVEIVCDRIGIGDMRTPTREAMRLILDRVDAALNSGRIVYVHCWGGKGRTGVVIGCWLARHGIAVGAAALEMLAELRRQDAHGREPSPETHDQRELARSWRVGE